MKAVCGRVGILGGTFNPVHVGHVRHAVEVGEALGLDRVLLAPCVVPPHKSGKGLLAFPLRVELLRAAVEGIERLDVTTLEEELEGPSYTWNFLMEWRRRGGPLPFFLMGMDEFGSLGLWHRGRDLPGLAHLVVASREGTDRALFAEAVRRLWPDTPPSAFVDDDPPACPSRGDGSGGLKVALSGGGECVFLPVPRLDVSASFVRERWRRRREMHGLMPDGVLRLLEANRAAVDRVWNNEA